MAAASRRCGWTGRRAAGTSDPRPSFSGSCAPHRKGGLSRKTQQTYARDVQGVLRRDVLNAGLVAGVTLSAWPLARPPALWGAEAGQPKRGGILRGRGYDPVHFDPHRTLHFKTNTTLSFVYNVSSLPILEKGEQFPRVICILAL